MYERDGDKIGDVVYICFVCVCVCKHLKFSNTCVGGVQLQCH